MFKHSLSVQIILLSLLFTFPGVFLFAGGQSLLSLKKIFTDHKYKSKTPGASKWFEEGKSYTILEDSKTIKNTKDIARYDTRSGQRKIIVPSKRFIPAGKSKPLTIKNYSWSKDKKKLLIFTNTKRVWRQETRGDYWVLDIRTWSLNKLGGDAEASKLMFAKFSPGGKSVAYVYKKNIYVQDLKTFKINQLTRDSDPHVINGTSDWVYEEEFHLRDGFRWSPDGKYIAYWQFNTKGVKNFSLVNYTAGLYPRIKTYPYPKAGEKNSACRVGVVNISSGETSWIKVPGDSRNNYIPKMEWLDNSKEIVLQQLNRLQNTDTIMSGDIQTGGVKRILTETDKAWVDIQKIKWLKDGKRFLWLSERDGWKHLYMASRSTKQTRLLTRGNFDVINLVGTDEKKGWLYYISSPENPTQRYLYKIKLDGTGKPERVSPADQPGTHSYRISPNARWAFHTYSSFGRPPVVDLVSLPGHKSIRVIENNAELSAKIKAVKKGPMGFFRVDIGKAAAAKTPGDSGKAAAAKTPGDSGKAAAAETLGKTGKAAAATTPGKTGQNVRGQVKDILLDGWYIKPPDFNPVKKYPILFYVYGEPAGQTVLDKWGGDYFLWFLLLAQRGYIVASVDNRGTPAPRGREWRKCIYRKIGILASQDQAKAVRAITKKWPFVDSKRIGIWGWSGGGSMSLNAIFRYPKIYKMAMAIAFISNQRFYDTIYQERYMGLPKDNKKGFVEGSPITYAKNLQGNLLVVYGTGDDNCHYQNCQVLINELVKYNKYFTMMAYPNRTHSLSEGKGTKRHLFELLTRYLKNNLGAAQK